MTELAVHCARLTRTFASQGRRHRTPERTALDAIDLDIPYGRVHGLLGPNGAGKSTLVKILSTLLLPTSGMVEVAGFDVTVDDLEVRRRVGLVLGGDRGFYARLTVRDNMQYWAALFGLRGRVAASVCGDLMERFGLTARADSRVETLSRGTKQRLHLARSLVGDPRLVILDEPTLGMDPIAAGEFRTVVRDLRSQGRTVVIATHDMSEAEQLCDEVSLIEGGRIHTTAQPRQLSRWMAQWEFVDVADASPSALAEVARLSGVAEVEALATGAKRIHTDADDAARSVLAVLVAHGSSAVHVHRPSLEDVYRHVITTRGLEVR